MTLSSTTDLAIAELVIYILLLAVVFIVLVRHGKHGLIGWFFLIVFCLLRIVADGLLISDGIKESKGESFSATGSIINSVGVSPLMLAMAGILFEA
jgi:prolipoprotein diacylglyceryltransferase